MGRASEHEDSQRHRRRQPAGKPAGEGEPGVHQAVDLCSLNLDERPEEHEDGRACRHADPPRFDIVAELVDEEHEHDARREPVAHQARVEHPAPDEAGHRDGQGGVPNPWKPPHPVVLLKHSTIGHRRGRTIGWRGRGAAHRLLEAVQVADGEGTDVLTEPVEAPEGERAEWTQLDSTAERDDGAVGDGIESPFSVLGNPLPDEIGADDRLLTARLADGALILENEPLTEALRGAVASRRGGTVGWQRFNCDYQGLPLRLIAQLSDKSNDLAQRSRYQDPSRAFERSPVRDQSPRMNQYHHRYRQGEERSDGNEPALNLDDDEQRHQGTEGGSQHRLSLQVPERDDLRFQRLAWRRQGAQAPHRRRQPQRKKDASDGDWQPWRRDRRHLVVSDI